MEYKFKLKLFREEFIFGLWLICLFLLFVPVAVYPLAFIFTSIALFYIYRPRKFSKSTIFALFFFAILLLTGAFSHLLHTETSVIKFYTKMIVNFTFLWTFFVFFKFKTNNSLSLLHKLEKFLFVLLILSALQCLLSAAYTGMLGLPFAGRVNSEVANRIIESPILFGSKEKNMWALKTAYMGLMFLGIRMLGISTLSKRTFGIGLVAALIGILYTFSRTAQLIFLIPFFYWIYVQMRQSQYPVLRYAMTTLFVLISLAALPLIYQKFFAIQLDSMGDGFTTRLVMWSFYFNLLPEMNLWTGNGILFGHTVLPDIDRFELYFHNIVLDVLADYGFFGLIAVMGSYAIAFFHQKIKNWKFRIFNLIWIVFPVMVAVSSQAMFFEVDVIFYLSYAFLIHAYIKSLQIPKSAPQI